MATAVVMPKAGISVESCIIGKWHKKVGEAVAEGETLFDFETDKASFECTSTASGTLLEIFFSDGDEVPCLVPVCAIGTVGEDVSALRPNGVMVSQAADMTPVTDAGQAAAPVAAATAPAGSGTGNISPRAQGLAKQMHLDSSFAVPTGPHGRIIARDIEALAASDNGGAGIGGRVFDASDTAVDIVTAPITAKPESKPAYADEKMSNIRRAISKAMTASLQNTAQLTHHHSCDATMLMNLRQQFKSSDEKQGLSGISINDMVLFAVSRTLNNHPHLNAHLLSGDTMRLFSGVQLGVAVDTPRGLMVPTIFDADKKSLLEISKEAKYLANICRTGSINPDLLQGGSFTVSNLGSLGVEVFTPIINPPQVAILGVCGISPKVRSGADGIELYQSMGLSVTYDHRAVDGAPASRFAQELVYNLEHFSLLLAL